MLRRPVLNCINCQSLALSVFCTLKSDELLDLNKEKVSYHYKKGQVIFSESNRPSGIFCVHSGKVKIYKINSEGKEQIVRLAKDGDLIGYRSFLANEAYHAFAETLEESVICTIPGPTVLQLLSQNINLSLKMMEHMAKDILAADQKSVDLLAKTARERLCEAIVILYKSFGVDEDGFIDIRLTRENIGNLTGMAIETVVRTLKEISDEGLIVRDKKRLLIPDIAKLMDEARMVD